MIPSAAANLADGQAESLAISGSMVLPDLDIWLYAFSRHQSDPQVVAGFSALVRQRRICSIAPIRQGLLTRCRDLGQHARLNTILTAFGDLRLDPADHVRAAELAVSQREQGISVPAWHALLWSVCARRQLRIWSRDRRWASFTAAGCPWLADPGIGQVNLA